LKETHSLDLRNIQKLFPNTASTSLGNDHRYHTYWHKYAVSFLLPLGVLCSKQGTEQLYFYTYMMSVWM